MEKFFSFFTGLIGCYFGIAVFFYFYYYITDFKVFRHPSVITYSEQGISILDEHQSFLIIKALKWPFIFFG
jgi:hypothetical protein